jgi:hypothetical protein
MKFTLKLPSLTTSSSRYHQDWEELEFLVRSFQYFSVDYLLHDRIAAPG